MRPTIRLASAPMARTFLVLASIATTLGSLITIPRFRTWTSVLAVPRSIPISREKRPRRRSNMVPGGSFERVLGRRREMGARRGGSRGLQADVEYTRAGPSGLSSPAMGFSVLARPTIRSGTVADLLGPDGNAIGLLRFGLAVLVIVHHSRVLGGFGLDPVLRFARDQADLGVFAVAGFFVISGFLVTRSAERSSSLRYLWHRALRVLPASGSACWSSRSCSGRSIGSMTTAGWAATAQ